MTVKETLVAARDRIEQNWFKGSYRDDSALPDDECAVCMLGAVKFVLHGEIRGAMDYSNFVVMGEVERTLEAALPEDWTPTMGHGWSLLPQFNDDLRTDKGDILALFDRAIESCD